jgi:hypothetical protein
MRTMTLAILLFGFRGLAQNAELHFSGEVSRGHEFRREIGAGLVFQLFPTDVGWTIRVLPKTFCHNQYDDWALFNPPFRGRNMKYLEPSHGLTAQEAIQGRYEVWFVRSCADFKAEAARLDIVSLALQLHPP